MVLVYINIHIYVRIHSPQKPQISSLFFFKHKISLGIIWQCLLQTLFPSCHFNFTFYSNLPENSCHPVFRNNKVKVENIQTYIVVHKAPCSIHIYIVLVHRNIKKVSVHSPSFPHHSYSYMYIYQPTHPSHTPTVLHI